MTHDIKKITEEDLGLYVNLIPNQDLIDQIRVTYKIDIASVFISPPPMGGDLWGVFSLPDQRLCIFCADISGHGPKIAPVTKWLHELIHVVIEDSQSPKEFLNSLNEALYRSFPRGQFVTFFYGLIDQKNKSLTYSCSASPSALYKKDQDSPFELLSGEGHPLGFDKDAVFEEQTVVFSQNSQLGLYSDALTETPYPPHNVFSETGLCDYLNNLMGEQKPHSLTKAVMDRLNTDKNPLCDDLTLVFLQQN